MTTETDPIQTNAVNLETGEALSLDLTDAFDSFGQKLLDQAEYIEAQRKIAAKAKRDANVERPPGYHYGYPKQLRHVNLSGRAWQVLWFLLSKGISPGGLVHIRSQEYADELGLYDRTTFQKHVRALVSEKVLIRVRRGVYQLNPTMIWVGSASTQVAATLHLRSQGFIE